MPVSKYEQRPSCSEDMARVLAGIENRGPDGAGLVPENPAPAPTVLTDEQLAEKQRHIIGIPQGPVPGTPAALVNLIRGA